MPDQDVNQNSSSELADAIASSPEAIQEVKQQIQDTQTPTAEKGVSPEPEPQQTEEPRVPYSRLKEVVDERNYFKQLWEQDRQNQLSQQQFQQPVTQPQPLGNTPEEREFFRTIEMIADRKAEQKIQQLTPLIDAARAEIARQGVVLFHKEHPDVKPNSPEEMEIAQKMRQGYPMEDAYRIVMWDKVRNSTTQETKQQFKQQIAAKKQANVETSSSIPNQAQSKPKMSFREELAKRLEAEK